MLVEIENNNGYFISNTGKVYSSKARKGHSFIELKQRVSNSGYLYVMISAKVYYVHRLVAVAFIPNPENKEQVNHIDGNKLNNCAENLEWCTQSENCRHYRDSSTEKQGKTAGRHGKLYQRNELIKEFRSLQSAKDYCKENYHCTLCTIGTLNVNYGKELLFIRNSSDVSPEKFWADHEIKHQEDIAKTVKTIFETKAFSCRVEKDGKVVGYYRSIRDANEKLHLSFRKETGYTCRGYCLFIQ